MVSKKEWHRRYNDHLCVYDPIKETQQSTSTAPIMAGIDPGSSEFPP